METMKTPLVGSSAAAKAAGISLRQLYHWVDALRVVEPQIQQCGMRRYRRFTAADLTLLKEVHDLVRRGYTLQAAVRLARHRMAS
jgi:DNA-binding transcriptional MerR regulator